MRERASIGRVFSADERRQDLPALTRDFNGLVDVICRVGQFVPSSGLNSRYGEASRLVRSRYEPHRRFLRCYYAGNDPLLELIEASSLDEWLAQDDGAMMERIQQVQRAIGIYERHLECLVKVRG